jgi:membrane protease YdiL (CAAX protease family)
MTRPQIALVLHALALIGAMSVLVPTLTAISGPSGYLLVMAFYWIAFCVPVVALHVWNWHGGRLFSERLAWRDWFVPGLLLLQVGMIGVVGVVPHTAILTTHGAMLAAAVALLNGPLEEAAWRGGFLTTFRDRPRLGFWLGWALFTAWHVPLALSQNIVFEGGWPALVGGAAALGLLWSWIAWRTGSVFWTAIAHTLTNVLTFWVLFNANGFA